MRRRALLTTLAAAALPGCVSQRLLRATPDARGDVLVPEAELASLGRNETLVVRAGAARVLLRKVGGEVLALDPTCTHSGCAVDIVPDGYDCPCHGAHYAADGTVQGGPAKAPLRRLPVERVSDDWRVALGEPPT